MASTQQLVRVDLSELHKACDNVEHLRAIVNYKLPKDLYFDADWFPVYFKRLLQGKSLDSELMQLFSISVDGMQLVNNQFPLHELGDTPTYVPPEHAPKIANALEQIIQTPWQKDIPKDLKRLNRWMNSDFDESPLDYFADMLKRLHSFYAKASHHSQAVICWWD